MKSRISLLPGKEFALFVFAIIGLIGFYSCKKESAGASPSPKAMVEFIDYSNGKIVTGLKVKVEKKSLSSYPQILQTTDDNVTDRQGNLRFDFDPDKEATYVSPIANEFHKVSYSLFDYSAYDCAMGPCVDESILANFVKRDAAVVNFQVRLLRKSDAIVRIRQKTQYPEDYILYFYSSGYSFTDTTDQGEFIKLKLATLHIPGNRLLDTTISVDLFDQTFNRISVAVTDLWGEWYETRNPVVKVGNLNKNFEIVF